ncbi:MAG: tRNA (adenosine(37)-N6)-threonylcarbamoyltransferase complex dimerization subunit type 1 TsaB [Clostridia bacterium]|nr:tRNA (adenosine(37)-N6)-threonylcarbamoyltransferase complex dimerization subunit type 1 TsaB [Clostridia bacterium]
MLIFGIDTCCMAATAALMDEERLLAQTVVNNKKTHSQKMMPQIEELFGHTELSPEDIDYYAAAVGPGSFTGVRIGVATVKAMAQAFNKPCIAISTLHALANNVALFDGIICPILDARRDQVYNALFRGGRELERLCDDRALAISELLIELKETDGEIIFLGDGVSVFKGTIVEELGERARFAPLMSNMNLAASVAELGMEYAKKGETVSYGDLVPQYVRLSQAERERIEKEGK